MPVLANATSVAHYLPFRDPSAAYERQADTNQEQSAGFRYIRYDGYCHGIGKAMLLLPDQEVATANDVVGICITLHVSCPAERPKSRSPIQQIATVHVAIIFKIGLRTM